MQRPPDDDARLSQEYRDGDSSVRSRIVALLDAPLRREAARSGLCATDIDDAVQEAWARVLRATERIDPAQSLVGLLMTTVKNVCRSMRRARSLHARGDIERFRTVRMRDATGSRFSQESVAGALRRLTAAQSSIVQIVCVYHVPIPEVARLNAVSEVAVRCQLSRARSRLRDSGDGEWVGA